MNELTSSQTRVLAVDDDADATAWLRLFLEGRGFDVRTAHDARTTEVLCEAWQPDVVLLDLCLPDVHGMSLLRRVKELSPASVVIIVSGRATIPSAVEAMSAGAVSLLEKPVSAEGLATLLDRLGQESDLPGVPDTEVGPYDELNGMLSRDPVMRQLFELVRTAAPTDANILIVGENGTGKELVAGALHALSPRSAAPFVKINCAAIPSELLESELFGHRRGAFTGATADRKGLFEVANRGSLLLDEVAEMPTHLQVKLLRVIQDREFRPVGGATSIKADFRLICATNRDVLESVRAGQLREDLYFRINTITLRLPPLRERVGDIMLLARHFLTQFAAKHARDVEGFNASAVEALRRHHWPGNVRELEHVIERAVILAGGRHIKSTDLPQSVRNGTARRAPTGVLPRGCTLEELERLAILQTLELTDWNKRETASILGIHRPTLYNKLRKYRLWRPGDRFRRDA
jgi:DNA-binding NtrC family response regulator